MELVTALIIVLVTFAVYKVLDKIIRWIRVSDIGDKYILVTGCDTGFGHEAAKGLDRLGCHVFAACLTENGEGELRKQCSPRLRTLYMDVSKPESVRKAYEKVTAAVPKDQGLWGVLNNAGILGKVAPDEWLHIKDYQQVLNVNLLGLIDVTMTFLPLIKRGHGGRIVNTASMAARCAFPKVTAYSISKYGVEGFSDSIRRHLKLFNVSVHLIEPGAFKTNIANRTNGETMIWNAWNEAPEHAQHEYGKDYVYQMLRLSEVQEATYLSSRLCDVATAYEHALLGRYPRARYKVGPDANILLALNSLLPEWLMDWIIRTASSEITPHALRKV